MKTAALAVLALMAALPGLALPGTARAETITRDRIGCRSQEASDRLTKFVMAGDAEGYGQLLRSSLASGECRGWVPGQEVRIDKRSGIFACFALKDATEPCYWTSVSAIEKPEPASPGAAAPEAVKPEPVQPEAPKPE